MQKMKGIVDYKLMVKLRKKNVILRIGFLFIDFLTAENSAHIIE